MKIHSNILLPEHFDAAAKKAGVTIVGLRKKGSQSRAYAFDFSLSGSGRHGGQWGSTDYKAATWDEWGMFLAHLFDVDADAHTGKNGYLSADHFYWVTDDRYRSLTPAFQHLRHRWTSVYAENVGQDFIVNHCDCGADLRHLRRGIGWEGVANAGRPVVGA